MPLNRTTLIPAPQGMNSAVAPALLPPGRCERIVNFRADRAGFLRGCLDLSDIATLGAIADGISYFYGETPSEDRLLVAAEGALYAGVPYADDSDPQRFQMVGVGFGFETGKRVRSVSYERETVFVQEDGIQPLRYDGAGLYQLGITPPPAPTVSAGTPNGGVSDNKTGTISYYVSYFDSRFRESDVGSGTSINYASYVGKCGFIAVDFGDDPQVHGVYIYATTSGGTTKYRIGTLLKGGGQFVLQDNFADSIVNTGTQAPSPGQYGVPNPASCIALHKRHLCLNDTTDPKVLQINNIAAPTHWASVTLSAADGIRMNIGTHQGAGVTALATIGSILFISTRSEVLQMRGDSPTTGSVFNIRSLLNSQGVLAAETLQNCNNAVLCLMNDGKVYACGGADNFLLHEVSQEIEPELRSHTQDELEQACAVFIENTYILSIGLRQYLYDFTGQGWTICEGMTSDPVFVNLTSGGMINANA